MKKVAVVILFIMVVLPVLLLLVISSTPSIALSPAITAIGQNTPLPIMVHDPHGARTVTAYVEQNGARYKAAELSEPSRHIFWHRHVADKTWGLVVGTKTTPQLKDGKAKLIIEATSNDFRSSTTRLERDVTIATEPPSLSVDSDQHYLYLGMADLVAFNVSGYWTEAGVKVGDQTFRSWPMPNGKPGPVRAVCFLRGTCRPRLCRLFMQRIRRATPRPARWFFNFRKTISRNIGPAICLSMSTSCRR